MTRPDWALLNRILKNEADETDQRRFAEWIAADEQHRRIYEELHTGYHQLDHREGLEAKEAFKQLKARISTTAKTRPIPYLRIAASVILVLGAALTVSNFNSLKQWIRAGEMIVIQAPEGQKKQFRLADGTVVWLNAESTMTFPKEFQQELREVYLDGEAFFDVAKDAQRPFIVHMKALDLKVLGTSFHASSMPDAQSEVALITGKLEVTNTQRTEQKVILMPGEMVVFDSANPELIKHKTINELAYTAWTSDHLVFDATPIREVLQVLQRKYHVDFEVENDDILSCSLTATFDGHSLQRTLKLLAASANLNFTKNDHTVSLSGTGCQN